MNKTAEVRRVAAKYMLVDLTAEQARELVKNDKSLADELGRGELDTTGRDCLGAALVDAVFRDESGPQHPDRPCFGADWHWPLLGSDPGYTAEFLKTFARLAHAKGYRLIGNWKKLL